MKLTTIFLVGVLCLLVLLVGGVQLGEHFHGPNNAPARFLRVVYAPTFFVLDLVGQHKGGKTAQHVTPAGVAAACGLYLLTPALYSAVVAASVGLIRRRKANQAVVGTSLRAAPHR